MTFQFKLDISLNQLDAMVKEYLDSPSADCTWEMVVGELIEEHGYVGAQNLAAMCSGQAVADEDMRIALLWAARLNAIKALHHRAIKDGDVPNPHDAEPGDTFPPFENPANAGRPSA